MALAAMLHAAPCWFTSTCASKTISKKSFASVIRIFHIAMPRISSPNLKVLVPFLLSILYILSASAFCPGRFETKPTKVNRYSHIQNRQQKFFPKTKQFYIGYSSKSTTFTSSAESVYHSYAITHNPTSLFLASSNSQDEPERKRFSQLLRSYKFMGKFFKQILKILVRFSSGSHFLSSLFPPTHLVHIMT
jgi:hypothetical protein